MGVKLAGRKFWGRFNKKRILQEVQLDVKEFSGCRIYDENGAPLKLYLNVFIDSKSRRILSYKIWSDQKQHIAMDPLRELVETYGVPDSILTDNGKIYQSKVMQRACQLLNIKLKYCRPRQPQAKGKIERLFLNLNACESQFAALGKAPLNIYVACVQQWIENYNQTKSTALNNRSPNEVFYADGRQLTPVPKDIIEIAFRQSGERTVAKDGTISLYGRIYQIPQEFVRVGAKVELLIDDNGQVEMVKPDYSTIPLRRQIIEENVAQSVLTNVLKPEPALQNAGYLLALLREKARSEGTYTTEAEFMQGIESAYANLPDEVRADISDNGISRGSEPASPYRELFENINKRGNHE